MDDYVENEESIESFLEGKTNDQFNHKSGEQYFIHEQENPIINMPGTNQNCKNAAKAESESSTHMLSQSNAEQQEKNQSNFQCLITTETMKKVNENSPTFQLLTGNTINPSDFSLILLELKRLKFDCENLHRMDDVHQLGHYIEMINQLYIYSFDEQNDNIDSNKVNKLKDLELRNLKIQHHKEIEDLRNEWNSNDKKNLYNNPSPILIDLREKANRCLKNGKRNEQIKILEQIHKREIIEAKIATNKWKKSYLIQRLNLERKYFQSCQKIEENSKNNQNINLIHEVAKFDNNSHETLKLPPIE